MYTPALLAKPTLPSLQIVAHKKGSENAIFRCLLHWSNAKIRFVLRAKKVISPLLCEQCRNVPLFFSLGVYNSPTSWVRGPHRSMKRSICSPISLNSIASPRRWGSTISFGSPWNKKKHRESTWNQSNLLETIENGFSRCVLFCLETFRP